MKKTLLLLALSLNSLFAGVENTVVTCAEDFARIFPATVEEAERQVDAALASANDQKKSLLSIPLHERTFANTVRAYDRMKKNMSFLCGDFFNGTIFAFSMLHGDSEHRNEPLIRLQKEAALLLSDYALFEALSAYEVGAYTQEKELLTAEEISFFEKVLHSYRCKGAGLGCEKYASLSLLFEQETAHAKDFYDEIVRSVPVCIVDEQELSGMSKSFIEGLPRTREGECELRLTKGLYSFVMSHCTNACLRKKVKKLKNNHAYPKNIQNLEQLIGVRQKIAEQMGYESYADYSLADSMIGSRDNAEQFLGELSRTLKPIAQKEWDLALQDLPEDVNLENGKVQAWDTDRVITHYAQQHFSVDMQKVAEYFAFEHVFSKMLDLYGAFFGVTFEMVSDSLDIQWGKDTRVLAVRLKEDKSLLGHILLDLYSRPGKGQLAGSVFLWPRSCNDSGVIQPAAAVVIGVFSPPKDSAPTLLSFSEVTTLFREFGRTMRCVLAESTFASLGVYGLTEHDFVEVPPSMFGKWIATEEQIDRLSSHYLDGSSLSKEVVKKILASNVFGQATASLLQIEFAKISLNFHSNFGALGLDALADRSSCYLEDIFLENPHSNRFASFLHLSSYKASYYCYLYAEACAAELFAKLKEEGLYADGAGRAYVDALLRPGVDKGGIMRLSNFLGRAPSYEAFFASLREENL